MEKNISSTYIIQIQKHLTGKSNISVSRIKSPCILYLIATFVRAHWTPTVNCPVIQVHGKTGCTGRSYRCAWATKKGSIKNPCQTIKTFPVYELMHMWKWFENLPMTYPLDWYMCLTLREKSIEWRNINIPYMDPMGYEKHMNLVISYHTLALSREVLIEHWTHQPATFTE